MNHTALREESHDALADAVITEAVRWTEQSGPLDDAQALRAALAGSAGNPRRAIGERARSLGLRIGLQAELARARQWAPWMLIALVALVVLAGLGLAGSVVGGSERRINVIAALASLLGLHAITLLLWLAGLAISPGASPFSHFSLGWLWLALTARVAGGRHGQAPVLVRAATGLLARARLLPWAFGLVSHGIWTLSFAVVLAATLFALAFRSYTLNWETTILDPGFFVHAVQALGWAPAQLGFPVPDTAAVLAAAPSSAGTATAAAANQRSWALWLMGCIVVYGLLPRLALALLSAAVWQRRKRTLRPDWDLPYYRRLLARLAALAPATVVDADPGRTGLPQATPGRPSSAAYDGAPFVIGFELPPDAAWPPAGLPAGTTKLMRVDGSSAARRALLDQLAQARPRSVLMVCRAAASPDRGTERFLRDVLAHCGDCRLWLADDDTAANAGDAAAAIVSQQRWLAWLRDTGLGRIEASAQPFDARVQP